jgi:hypothetical protein
MPKKPKDVPEVGDRCRLRGSHMEGVLVNVDTDNYWASVKWDVSGPTICPLFELRKEPAK